jgi:hypothetical protein
MTINNVIINYLQVFGAKPLEDVVRNLRSVLMSELEAALSQQVGISTVSAFATENV